MLRPDTMQSHDAVLVGLLIVLVAVIAYQSSKKTGGEGFCGGTDTLPFYPPGVHNPYTILNKQIGALRGARHDAFNQPPLWRQPGGLDRYHRSGATIRPEDVAAADRAMWFTAPHGGTDAQSDHEMHDAPEVHDIHGTHGTHEGFAGNGSGGMDYNTYIADLVVDPRTRDNHHRWVEEMRPWSGTAAMVDDMDEAMEATTHFTGLRRPQPIAIHNPLQLTERDTSTFISNARFNFKG